MMGFFVYGIFSPRFSLHFFLLPPPPENGDLGWKLIEGETGDQYQALEPDSQAGC
ncbi:hypothetical protein D3C76_1398310 [compost metagenome]